MDKIIKVKGREILNAKGKPTVEATVITESGVIAKATVPSGTSRGKYEAHELYDGGERYGGYGTKTAAKGICTEINDALCGMDVTDQKKIDETMIALDGTYNKERLGGNALIAVSMAAAKAGAMSKKIPLYKSLTADGGKDTLPDVIATVISGGEYSPSGLEFEDYLYIFHGYETFEKMLEDLTAARKQLEKILVKEFGDFPEDGGALAPPVKTSAEAFEWMLRAAEDVGCREHVTLGLDVAASELYDEETGKYHACGKLMSKEELTDYYVELCEKYPLTYIEDPFDQDDFESCANLKKLLPGIQIIGDDLFVTNVERLQKGIEMDCATTLLLKVNQIGTVTEAIAANDMSIAAGMDVTVSMRSGDTPEDFIADLSVAIGARQIKLGSPVRAERTWKYNRLLEIESELLGLW